MYSSSRSATTHIFFPPRFEIVAEQENSDGFPSYTGNQFALDSFFRYQTDGPTSATFRRTATYHCNQTLLLAVIEHFGRSRPLFLVQCALQAALQIPTADAAYGFGSERDYVSDLRCAGALCQLQQSQGAQDPPEPAGRRRSTGWQALFDASARYQNSEVDDPYHEYAPKQFYIKMVFTRSSSGRRPRAVSFRKM
jgi:hypothetical protein